MVYVDRLSPLPQSATRAKGTIMRSRFTAPAPMPCTTYVPTATGELVIASVETRDPVRVSNGWTADSVTYRFNVTCLQETGESFHVGRVATRAAAENLIDAHTAQHPEHHSYRVSPL